MKVFAPDYYTSFQCLQGKCKHTCCAGWEIDIDNESLQRYRQLTGLFARRVKDNIIFSEDGSASFRLSADERCPFLNGEGLCEMILTLGEDALCQICTDHPRFRNEFSDRIEIGLGLCCEAAGDLILNWKTSVCLQELSDDERKEEVPEDEEAFFKLRKMLFKLIQDRGRTIKTRLLDLLQLVQVNVRELSGIQWVSFLLDLERLDDAWTQRLYDLKQSCRQKEDHLCSDTWEIAFEQLLVYLLYRHLSASVFDGDWQTYVVYCVFVMVLVRQLCVSQLEKMGSVSLKDLVEIARLYSSEIEYSDQNMDAILDRIRTICINGSNAR